MSDASRSALRLLSWNIQTGVNAGGYHHYVTGSWKHLLPHRGRVQVLDRIAAVIGDFDIVALQETDSGSLRTGFVNQTEYLAHRGGFRFWRDQTNRELGGVARHANGLLSRLRPSRVEHHALPGIPGRGLIHARYGRHAPLHVFVLHLALGRRGRQRQVGFLAELLADCRHAVVMGDFNCTPDSVELRSLTERAGLGAPGFSTGTFPSWRPRRHIDHILVSSEIDVQRLYVPDWICSDHLPVALDARLPAGLDLAADQTASQTQATSTELHK